MTQLTSNDYLAHFGVKGMRWGVRRERRLQRANRVASGTASKRDRIGFSLTDTSNASVIRNKGLQGAASVRAKDSNRSLSSAQKQRKQMLKNNEISKAQYNAGTARFGRNLALGVLAGVGAGVLVGKAVTGAPDVIIRGAGLLGR